MTDMKQGLRALRLGSSGGPDGMTARLLLASSKYSAWSNAGNHPNRTKNRQIE